VHSYYQHKPEADLISVAPVFSGPSIWHNLRQVTEALEVKHLIVFGHSGWENYPTRVYLYGIYNVYYFDTFKNT
jgi:hypothetical protein